MRSKLVVVLLVVALLAATATVLAAPFASGVVQKFSDLLSGRWYHTDVEWGRESGCLRGYPDGTYRADTSATRGELAAALRQCFEGRQTGSILAQPAPAAPSVQGPQIGVPVLDQQILGLPAWVWLLLPLLLLALLIWWLLWGRLPRIWNRVRGLQAGYHFGTAEAHARLQDGVDSRITKEVSNLSREQPGHRRYRRSVFARRGNTLKWRVGWHNDEWVTIPAGEVQYQDLLGPGQTFVPGSARLSIGQEDLIPVPGALNTSGHVFSLADIPGAPAELPARSTAFLYFKTRINFNGNAGQPAEGNQQAQGHNGHGPDAGEN